MHLNLNLNQAPNLNLNLNMALNLNLNLNPTGIRFPPTSKEGPKERPIVGLAFLSFARLFSTVAILF